jgi:prepilin-type N-terminal cleavage/methylation domain-containing protein
MIPIKQQNGMTLVELLVAISIFTFAVLGLAAGTVALVRTNQNSHLNAAAINLAQAKLEEFRAMTTAAFATLSCPAFTSPGCSDSPVASAMTFTRSWQFTANSPVAGVSRIDVRVAWSDYANQSLTLTASVSQ